ncbi:hypothetical protein BDW02DRAFT_238266 [Decorospora gaudefroyi]|uniref:Uncharacterized protein n=1 Tax=Decorospora gaudefroyi TaxID=184978 RepID=A0A6A5KH65_9PLEO|nr:hypothetical protein BDW02DRAFT_238266 [Decorospora gaudefroyi]
MSPYVETTHHCDPFSDFQPFVHFSACIARRYDTSFYTSPAAYLGVFRNIIFPVSVFNVQQPSSPSLDAQLEWIEKCVYVFLLSCETYNIVSNRIRASPSLLVRNIFPCSWIPSATRWLTIPRIIHPIPNCFDTIPLMHEWTPTFFLPFRVQFHAHA